VDSPQPSNSLYATVDVPDISQQKKRRRLGSVSPDHTQNPPRVTPSHVVGGTMSVVSLTELPFTYTRPNASPAESGNADGPQHLSDHGVGSMHKAQQPRTLEQGLVQGQLNLPGPQSEQDPHVSGWDITQEETTQISHRRRPLRYHTGRDHSAHHGSWGHQ
jgi:hypothetical protein